MPASPTQCSLEPSPLLSPLKQRRAAYSPYAMPVLHHTDISEANLQYYTDGSWHSEVACASSLGTLALPSVGPATPTAGHSNSDTDSPTGAAHAVAFPNAASPFPPSYEDARKRPLRVTTAAAAACSAAQPPAPSYLEARRGSRGIPSPNSPTLGASGMPSPNPFATSAVAPPSGPHRLIGYSQPTVPVGAYHAPLAGHCEFLQVPQINPVERPTPTFPCFRLFLGQVRFETTAAEVRWIIRNTAGVVALKIEPRGTGCFLAYFRTYEEMIQVKCLHKRLLFDHTGVWFARTPTQAEALHYYVSHYLGHVGRGFRLPKDTMVVEEEKSTVRGLSSNNSQFPLAPLPFAPVRDQQGSAASSGLPPQYPAPHGYHAMTSYSTPYFNGNSGSVGASTSSLEEMTRCHADLHAVST